jgi:hypothetical protein
MGLCCHCFGKNEEEEKWKWGGCWWEGRGGGGEKRKILDICWFLVALPNSCSKSRMVYGTSSTRM